MKDPAPQIVFLSNYRPPTFLIEQTRIHVDLHEDITWVSGTLDVIRNTDPAADRNPDLILEAESMACLEVRLNGKLLKAGKGYTHEQDKLRVMDVGDQFRLETRVEIHPENNSSLMGLYKSRTMFCTQCEAEGFRKITPYLDRPDVLSRFKTTLVADREKFPVLLSNGNLIEQFDTDGGRHGVTWEDPFRKPAYLFALVAGDLQCIEDSFVTISGRKVCLRMYVEPKDLDKCEHALKSLKAAMHWDEEVYGREYDLDIFMIVAVDDFNMGAMENKGLNIFNTSAVLANPKTTTDARFQWVEAVVAHEYFHNWSGNRVTCRDWFQLSLKEGFTVFRDSEFSADHNSRTVKRIEDVRGLRAHQFAEDAGPLAHPVQPDSYMEINNFYTATVYEKGAEIVRMQANLLGPKLFRQGTDLYFERYDGQAATIEHFVGAMEEVSGRDLTQFKRWYKQAGTPVLKVNSTYDAQRRELVISFTQECPPTAEMEHKKPFLIPVRMGLLGARGELPLHSVQAGVSDDTETVLQISGESQTFVFTDLEEAPVPSLLRSFSAPVKLEYDYSREDLQRLITADSDGFNRWDAIQRLVILDIQSECQKSDRDDRLGDSSGSDSKGQSDLIGDETSFVESTTLEIFRTLINDRDLDPAMVSLMITLPSMEYLAELQDRIDLEQLYRVRNSLRKNIATALKSELAATYRTHCHQRAYQPVAADIASRSLKNTCLQYWTLSGDPDALSACTEQFHNADNMTDQSAALTALVNAAEPSAQDAAANALEHFYQQWSHEELVLNTWLSIQSSSSRPEGLERVKKLMLHPAFDTSNPNKLRALIGGFCGLNPDNFHHPSGTGYEFLTDRVLELNQRNPQIASRLVIPLTKWRKLDEGRAELMRGQLQRIAEETSLSPDLSEVVNKSLD